MLTVADIVAALVVAWRALTSAAGADVADWETPTLGDTVGGAL
jgi:hypothetical protein